MQHVDHFGNLDRHLPHRQAAHSASTSRCAPRSTCVFPIRRRPTQTPPWEEIRTALSGGGFPDADRGERIRLRIAAGAARSRRSGDYGAKSFTPGRPILEAARELTTRIKADFEYHPGATDISHAARTRCSPARPASARTSPMSMIAALRAHGLAAGYVSGYIRTVHSKEEVALRGADASHAWVAVWCGDGGRLGPSRPDQRPDRQGGPCRRRLGPRLLRREPAARRDPGRRARIPTAWRDAGADGLRLLAECPHPRAEHGSCITRSVAVGEPVPQQSAATGHARPSKASSTRNDAEVTLRARKVT